jgi:hypothetical protein
VSIKRDTFAERLAAYDRHWFRVTLVFVGAIVLIALGCPWAFGLSFWTPQEYEKTARVVCSLGLAVFCFAVLVFIGCHGRATIRRFRLVCPSCGAALTGRQRRPALAEGKCGKCGARISSEGRAEQLPQPTGTAVRPPGVQRRLGGPGCFL